MTLEQCTQIAAAARDAAEMRARGHSEGQIRAELHAQGYPAGAILAAVRGERGKVETE